MSNDLVVQTHDPFQVMDAWDDEQFLAEMQGAVAKSLVYEFNQGGQTVTGLSKVGVDECCMALTKRGEVIREEELEHKLIGEGEAAEALFQVRASRFSVAADGTEVRLDRVIGVKRQPLYTQTRAGLQFNPHWYETGAMKAARNARFRLIPGSIREGVIAAARATGQVRSNAPRPHTPPADRNAGRQPLDWHPRTEKKVPFGDKKGQPLSSLTPEENEKLANWCRAKDAERAAKGEDTKFDDLLAALDEVAGREPVEDAAE